MNRMFWLAAGACAVILGSASMASAQSVPGAYVTGEGGASFLPNLQLKGTPSGTQHESFNTGYAYGGAIGYDNGDGMRVEVDSPHQTSSLNKLGGTSANGHLQSTSVMLNGQADILHDAAITPYVGAGIGYENIGATVDGVSDRDWKPAYQAEAGLRKDISNQMSLFGEYRFSQSEAADLSDAGLSAHQHFADHGVLAGLTYHMGQ